MSTKLLRDLHLCLSSVPPFSTSSSCLPTDPKLVLDTMPSVLDVLSSVREVLSAKKNTSIYCGGKCAFGEVGLSFVHLKTFQWVECRNWEFAISVSATHPPSGKSQQNIFICLYFFFSYTEHLKEELSKAAITWSRLLCMWFCQQAQVISLPPTSFSPQTWALLITLTPWMCSDRRNLS